MLVAIRPSGAKPPLFFIHGLDGLMPLGGSLMRALPPDRPLYGLTARGFDGKDSPYLSVREMADDYLRQIKQVRPTGPYVLGGMCVGAVMALELAREFLTVGESVAPVILLDPPGLPPGYQERQLAPELHLIPGPVYRQLYDSMWAGLQQSALRHGGLPFDVGDPQQLHIAATVGVATLAAFSRHHLAPFHGATECFLSEQRALAHFNPALPWRGLLQGPRVVHVLPGDHDSLFDPNRDELWRMIAFSVEAATPAPATADA